MHSYQLVKGLQSVASGLRPLNTVLVKELMLMYATGVHIYASNASYHFLIAVMIRIKQDGTFRGDKERKKGGGETQSHREGRDKRKENNKQRQARDKKLEKIKACE